MAAEGGVDALAGSLAGAGQVVHGLGELAQTLDLIGGTHTGFSSPASARRAIRSASRRPFFFERDSAELGSFDDAAGENYVVALCSLIVGIVFATLSAQSGKLATRIYIQQKEFEAWERMVQDPLYAQATLPAAMPIDYPPMRQMIEDDIVTLLNGDVINFLPGIDLHVVYDCHSVAEQIVVVRNGEGVSGEAKKVLPPTSRASSRKSLRPACRSASRLPTS